MTADPPNKERLPIKEAVASNYVMHQHQLVEATEDFRYLRQRRDALSEKLKLGLVGLNGASLVALLGALGGSGAGAAWIGLTPENALYSAGAFAVGLVLAGHSLNTAERAYGKESADAFARAGALLRLAAIYEHPSEKEQWDRYKQAMDDVHELPLVGFQWSWRSILAQNFSGGAWLFGIAVPLTSPLRPAWLQMTVQIANRVRGMNMADAATLSTAAAAWIGALGTFGWIYTTYRDAQSDHPVLEAEVRNDENGARLTLVFRNQSAARWRLERLRVVRGDALIAATADLGGYSDDGVWKPATPDELEQALKRELNLNWVVQPAGSGISQATGRQGDREGGTFIVRSSDIGRVKLIAELVSMDAKPRRAKHTIALR
jgi:hypothetical protein